jgi:chromosome segregation ATPase
VKRYTQNVCEEWAFMPGQQEPPSPPLPGMGAPPSSSGSSSGSSGGGPASAQGGGGGSSGGSTPGGSSGGYSAASGGTTLPSDKGARFLSMGYASIAKLREEASKYEKLAFKERHRAAKLTTTMEKHRHRATVLREKEQTTLGKIPDMEADMNEQQKMLQLGASGTATGAVQPHDQSKIHVKIRKIQQKIANYQRKAKSLEHAAAHHLQIASQKKVLSDMHIEKAKQWEAEARAYTLMADRMQKATEPETLSPGIGH